MKNRIASILAVVMLATSCSAALAACGSGGGDNNTVTPTNFTSSTRPSMPTESMQTVAVADVREEMNTYKKKLYESETGSAQYYYGCGQKDIYHQNHPECEGNVFLGTSSWATQTTRELCERAGRYCGIKNNSGNTGAFTMHSNYINESKTDSTNPKLSYLNNEYYDNYTATGIQKDSEIFVFEANEGKDYDGNEYVNDEKLLYYSDDEGMYGSGERQEWYLPLTYEVAHRVRLNSVYELNGITSMLSWSYFYVMGDYDKTRLYQINWDDSHPTEIIDFSIKGFSFTVKKSATKLYASTKYTVVLETDSYEYDGNTKTWDEEIETEIVLLIDLGKPQSIDAGARCGKDISGITLTNYWANMAYPNITSAQLTQAVKEGKTITVDILGNGDVSNLELYGFVDYIPIENGKFTIDGAAIKESIDNGSAYFRQIQFVYLIDGSHYYYGDIMINYNRTKN